MGIQLEIFSLCQEIAKFDIWNIFYMTSLNRRNPIVKEV